MPNKIYHAVQPKNFNEMLNLSDELAWQEQKFLNLREKWKMNSVNYHFHSKIGICIGRTTECKQNEITKFEEKFIKEQNFIKYYCSLWRTSFENKYSKKSSNTAYDNCWYIPHYCIYHPTKPGIKGKKQQITGPDLTDHIISVLKKFREHEVAFTKDMLAMFYQVQITECQRSILLFLVVGKHQL